MFRDMMTGKISVKGRVLVSLAAVLLLITYFLPVWMVNLGAPQYPEGLRLWIYPNKITGDVNKINILNHYIGMKKITKESFPDFQWLTLFLAVMGVLSLTAAGIGRKQILPVLVIIFAIVGIFFLIRLDNWLYDYGHNFDPRAAMDIAPFKPPMLGTYKFANFTIFNYFHFGSLTLVLAPVMYFLAMIDYKLFKKSRKKQMKNNLPGICIFLLLAGVVLMVLTGCGSLEPEPFVLHEDECYYCRMRLTDLRFASQVIEAGNLHRKFCSNECMIAHIGERKPDIRKAFVMDYAGSGILEAQTAFYLISPNIPSPMGLNLAAFRTAADRDRYLKEKQGKAYDYIALFSIDVPGEFKRMTEKRLKEMEEE